MVLGESQWLLPAGLSLMAKAKVFNCWSILLGNSLPCKEMILGHSDRKTMVVHKSLVLCWNMPVQQTFGTGKEWPPSSSEVLVYSVWYYQNFHQHPWWLPSKCRMTSHSDYEGFYLWRKFCASSVIKRWIRANWTPENKHGLTLIWICTTKSSQHNLGSRKV